MVRAAKHAENKMDSEVGVTFYSKNKEKNKCFRLSVFMREYI